MLKTAKTNPLNKYMTKVQSSIYWASEASPTLGCSIEISRDIYTKYSTLPSGISVYIVPKVGIFPEAGGRGKYSLPRVQYMPIFHKEGF